MCLGGSVGIIIENRLDCVDLRFHTMQLSVLFSIIHCCTLAWMCTLDLLYFSLENCEKMLILLFLDACGRQFIHVF